jgi:hypothetical protein
VRSRLLHFGCVVRHQLGFHMAVHQTAAPIKLTIDEEQQNPKAWSDGPGMASQTNVKCSSSTTGTQVLEKLQVLADEQAVAMLKQGIQKKPGKFVKMEVVGLKFEGESLGNGTFASYGIKEGTTTISADTIFTNGEACCACDCCIPDGAWTIPCSGSHNIYKKGANSSEVSPGGAPAGQEMAR